MRAKNQTKLSVFDRRQRRFEDFAGDEDGNGSFEGRR